MVSIPLSPRPFSASVIPTQLSRIRQPIAQLQDLVEHVEAGAYDHRST